MLQLMLLFLVTVSSDQHLETVQAGLRTVQMENSLAQKHEPVWLRQNGPGLTGIFVSTGGHKDSLVLLDSTKGESVRNKVLVENETQRSNKEGSGLEG